MTLLLIFLLALLLLFPAASLEGARNGLLLWFHTVLPTLFPFLFLSSLLLATGAAHTISRILKPVLSPLFRVSTDCCYAILIGLSSGYPLGAKTCADLVENGSISRQEGQYLLCFCNNASPMFLISFIGMSLLKLPYRSCILLWLTILFSAFLTGIVYRIFTGYSSKSVSKKTAVPVSMLHTAEVKTEQPPLESALETAIQTITKVGGYIILFGILGHLILSLPLAAPLIRSSLAGILEITTGSNALAALGISPALKTVLICSVTAFGGLSSLLQTKSVLGSSGLSVSTYLYTKLVHALLAAALSGILVSVNML